VRAQCAAILLAFLAVYGGSRLSTALATDVATAERSIARLVGRVFRRRLRRARSGTLLYWPGIILGAAGNRPAQATFALTYVEGEILAWVTILVLLGITVGQTCPNDWRWRILVCLTASSCLSLLARC